MAPLTRRAAVSGALGAGAALAAACAGPAVRERPAPAKGPVTVELATWAYRPDIVRSNLDRFQEELPGITVEGPETGDCCARYRERTNTNFLAGYPMDALYMRDEDVAEWAEASWIRPLDGMPGARNLGQDEYPFVHGQTHHKGKRYGTIYYIGQQVLLYNREHLRRAGIGEPPAAAHLRGPARGRAATEAPGGGGVHRVERPGRGAAGGGLPGQRPAHVRPQQRPPLRRRSLFEEIVEWHVRAYQGDQFFGSTGDVQAPFDDRKTSFTWTSFSDLKRLNGRASGAVAGRAGGGAAGQLLNAANPSFVAGQTGGSGVCRQYAVAASSKHPPEAWRLRSFLGGKDGAGRYSVARRWWLEQGLWFGYKPLEQDPEVRRSAAGRGPAPPPPRSCRPPPPARGSRPPGPTSGAQNSPRW